MAVAEKAEKMLILRSSDNKEFELKESVAMQSVTVQKLIEGGCADKSIPLPNVNSHILAKVIEYCDKHAEPTGPRDASGATTKPTEDDLKIFDTDFVNVEQDTLLDLVLAANYLDIKGLLNLTRQTITDLMKGKMPEGVHKTNIKNNLPTPSTTTMPSKKKQMEARLKAYVAHLQETAEERMTVFAVLGEECRKNGHRPTPPPLEIVKFPELLGRAWGWDLILPYTRLNSWPLYKTYLQEYYERNSPEVLAHQVEGNAAAGPNLNGDDGNYLATLFNWCISKEVQLLRLLKHHDKEYNVDEISLHDELTNCADQITNMELSGYPPPIIALKCIMAEADLLRVLLMCETGMKSEVMLCSKIRKTAFRFLTYNYKGPECFAAAATMMATTKEAKLMCQLLRNICSDNDGPFESSVYTRNRTFGAMIRICEECSAVEGSTGGNIATKLISDDSDDKNPSEKELVNKDKQRSKIKNNTKICSEKELTKENYLEKKNEDECYDKTGSEVGIVGGNPGKMNGVKLMTEQRGLGKLHAVKQQMAEVIAALQVVQKPVEQEQLTKDKFELAPKFQEVLLRHKADILARQNEMEKSLTYQCRKLDTMFLQKQNHLEQQMQERLNLMEEMNLTKHNEIIQRFDTVVGLLQKLCNSSL